MNTSLLQNLTQIHSVTGDTKAMSSFISQRLNELNIPNFTNPFGTVIAGDPSKAKIMFVAHIDQVGFQITKINDDGTCNVLPVGWVFANRMDHASIYVNTKKGIVNGGLFHKNYLKSENIEKFSELFAFFGTTSAEETKSMGINVGDLGSFKKDYWETNTSIFASGIDNTISIFALLMTLKQNPEFINDTMIAFHNDEEMQDHGANSLGYEYPVEYCCILDYCPVHQQFDEEDVLPNINDGPIIVYRGGSHILHEDLKERLDHLNIFKAFISNRTLPSLEPQNFQNNGVTKAFNYSIPSIGYHGGLYAVLKADVEKFQQNLNVIKKALL
jgi:endoglucanase